MGSLSAGLNIALQSLLTEEGAIQTTSNNIANVNTPGYARQRPDLAENAAGAIGPPDFWNWRGVAACHQFARLDS